MLKVGVFDSGLGGLTVVQALSGVIKGAELFYVADTQNAPYGEKTPEQILQFSINVAQYLIDTHKIDALILACNTATAFAIKELRRTYPDLIIIGTEPGVKPAIEQTKTGNIGVLATPATLKGEKYQELVTSTAAGKNVHLFEQSCPGLVEQIEKGELSTPATKALLANWVLPMKENNVDTIVLGCTHYPLVEETIKEVMLCEVTLIHTGEAIAKHLLNTAQSKGHINEGPLNIQIYSTATLDQTLVNAILQNPKEITKIKI